MSIEQQQEFLSELKAATQREDWFASPRSAGMVLYLLGNKAELTRKDVEEAIVYAYKNEKAQFGKMDGQSILNLFDMTVIEETGHPVYKTLFDTLKKKADEERRATPQISLKKQFKIALDRVKNHAYAAHHNDEIGSSPLHRDVTRLTRDALNGLPRDLTGVDKDMFVSAVEDAAAAFSGKKPPKRSEHQAADLMWAVLKAIKPSTP
ncbi:MAG TPA: hypothetical protein VIN59_01220 [Alphaproteobacteria bacterium]